MISKGTFWQVEISSCGHFLAALDNDTEVVLVDCLTREVFLSIPCLCNRMVLSSDFLIVQDPKK